ncbi:MAG: hypothetical protein AAFS10_26890, partial [Myxococcota bacterium]
AFLDGTNLAGVLGQPQNRERCLLSWDTYLRSGWNPDILRRWHRAGAAIHDLDAFPEEIRETLSGTRHGLTLTFDGRLNAFEDFLIRSLILGVLGTDTDCHIVRTRTSNGQTTIALEASQTPDLEWVAEVLHQRAWEHASTLQAQGFFQNPELLQAEVVLRGLTDLTDHRLEQAELFAPENQGQHHRTWTFTRLLDPAMLQALYQEATESGLTNNRDALLAGLDTSTRARLERGDERTNPIMWDLNHLNRMAPLSDGTLPLAIWLRNTRIFTKATVFNRALKTLSEHG